MYIGRYNLYLSSRLSVVAICLLSATTGNILAAEIIAGPVVARLERVVDIRGHKLATDLLQAGLGTVYFGGKKPDWCALARLTAKAR